jgi:hypothetical protein
MTLVLKMQQGLRSTFMKRAILVITLLFLTVSASAQVKSPTEIASYFYQPIKMEKIPGIFNEFYKVLPSDNIPYKEVVFLAIKSIL